MQEEITHQRARSDKVGDERSGFSADAAISRDARVDRVDRIDVEQNAFQGMRHASVRTLPETGYPEKRISSRSLPSNRLQFWRTFAVSSFYIIGLIALVVPVVTGHAFLFPGAPSGLGTSSGPTLSVDTNAIASRVSPLLFGQDLYYLDAGKTVFSDAAQTTYDPSLLKYVQGLSPTILRCGGGLDSEWYHWVYGIGPLASRVPTQMGKAPSVRVDNFGTDDCLRYAEKFGATAIMQVDDNDYPVSSLNLWNPQATPKEAAALVAYVNGSSTDTHSIGVDEHGTDWKTVGYWAQKRVSNGHAAPYKIAYWEVGNEDYSFAGVNGLQYGKRFLLFAKAMKAVDPSVKTGAVLLNDEPNNIWNTQVPQVANSEIDFTIDHDYPMGDNSMERFFNPVTITRPVDFPVVASKSYTITMQAISFHGIKGVQPPSHMIFTIDGKSFKRDIEPGQFTYSTFSFTVPGSQLSNSGHHTVSIQLTQIQRYVDIYRDFTVNGETHPFFSEQEIYQNLLVTLEKVNWYVDGLQTTPQNAGLPKSVPLFITEYNLAFSPTTEKPMYSASVMTALLLLKYIQHGVGMASMFVLSQPSPQHWNAIASDDSNPNARVHWQYPQAYGFEIIRQHVGAYLLNSTVTNSPTVTAGIPVLNAVATKDPKTNVLHVIVSNCSYNQDVTANLNFENNIPRGPATVTTLNAPSLTSTSNSPTDSQIGTTTTTLGSIPAHSRYRFPAHSITAFDIQMSPQPPLPQQSLATPTPSVATGSLFGPSSGTITNSGALFTTGDNSWGDYTVSYSFTPTWANTTHSQETGIQFRFARASQNWGQVIFRPTGVFVLQHTASGYANEVQMSSSAIPGGQVSNVSLVVSANTVAVYLNGTRLGRVTLSGIPARGGIQFYAYYTNSVVISNAQVKN